MPFVLQLFMVLNAEKLLAHVQQVLETHEVNWQHVLSCVSTLLVCQPQAQQLLKDLLTRLLNNAFEIYDLETLIIAFLLARQAALEGPAVFIPYSEWFKISFGNSSSYHSSSKKSLVFLLKFLSDLVPFEPPQYLKVHVLHCPYVHTKYRPLLQEYTTLAKTRLADLKVSIEEMGLYEDLAAGEGPKQPHLQALQDVEKAMVIFEHTGKIPANVMEASIFRKSYYLSRFLPALLTPRVLSEPPDLRMAFIESLKRLDKIPGPLYSSYVQACCKEAEKLLEGMSREMEVDHPKEPFESLQAELEELRHLIRHQDQDGAVSAQVAVISERLRAVLDEGRDYIPVDVPITLNCSSPQLGPLELKVVDLLLKNFCQNLVAASFSSSPPRQGTWASLFVKMLCGHRRALAAVLTRMLNLICQQGPSLSDIHVLGLAAFLIHLHESKTLLPPIALEGPEHCFAPTQYFCFSEHLAWLLSTSTGQAMIFCMRFCTAAIAYAFCRASASTVDVIKQSVPPYLIHKLLYVLPRLSLEARDEACGGEVEALWNTLAAPSLNWMTAALALWRQSFFQEFKKEKDLQVTLRDWLMAELGIHPHQDILSDTERQDYQRWACCQLYLPLSSAVGGCDGDLELACKAIINAVVDSNNRSERKPFHQSDFLVSIGQGRSGYTDILCRLQEMVFDLELLRAKGLAVNCSRYRDSFLFSVFQERLCQLGDGSALGDQLVRQREIYMFKR
nr:PREDICTED: Fanconi anemia group A protein-like [Latimeria chalumnae]|eukprot:XP_014345825.1 PREDICTED: Fanconi anemia group A protein-like [Latimeria chalumnae]